MKKHIRIAAVLLIVAVSGSFFIKIYRERNACALFPANEFIPESVAFFYQKDKLFSQESLGSSKFTIGSSGCLICCISSAIIMQNTPFNSSFSVTPKSLNELFSKNNVYDSEGNLKWQAAGECLNAEFVKEDFSQISPSYVESLISNSIYPIVLVRMPFSGNPHFVLIVGSDNNSFLCMDPLNKSKSLTPLSKYGNKIYSLRYIKTC